MTPSGETPSPVDQSSARRSGAWHTLLTSLLALVLALVIGGLLIAVTDPETREAFTYFFSYPWDSFSRGWEAASSAYGWLFKGAILNPDSLDSGSFTEIARPISETMVYSTPVILTGLSVAVAFRAGMFNIGAQGQMIGGAVLAGYVGFAWHLPAVLHIILVIIAGMLGGVVFGGLTGWLKAKTGAHEVITTIMLNYVAINLLGWLLTQRWYQAGPPYDLAQSKHIDSSASLPKLLGGDLRANIGLLIALVAAAGVWWLLERSTIGFKLRAVGANPNAARTAGMSIGGASTLAMTLAGLLAGVAGAMQVMGPSPQITSTIDNGAGFDGITVALLGRGKPVGVIAAGLLLGALRRGGQVMASNTGTPIDIVFVTQALMVLFIAAPPLIRMLFRIRVRGGLAQAQAKGWNA